MSILIKGLNMPKDDCEAYQELIITNNYVGNGKIQMLAHDSNTNEFIGEVVEVPEPHGRLIEAEKVTKKMEKIATEAWQMKLLDTVEHTLNMSIDIIKGAPTVIEAEEQEHE